MKKVFPIELEEDLHRRLKHAAIDAGLTLHALVVKVLEDHIDHKERAAPGGSKDHDQRANRGR